MNLLDAIESVLADAKLFLGQLSTQEYCHPIVSLQSSTIGQHTRHFIEFYQCLIAQQREGKVNYDLRKRNLQIETDPLCASQSIDQILVDLKRLDFDRALDQYTWLQTESIPTTTIRELLYNVEHTIHHLAIIRIGLCELCPSLVLPGNFGVAPSTVNYRKETTLSL